MPRKSYNPHGKKRKKRMYLEQVGDYTTPEGKADNQLIAEWEVSGKKEEKPFPTWSPFLKDPGILRRGLGPDTGVVR